MKTDRELDALVRDFLEEGDTRLPDRVLDAVLDRVPDTAQRRGPARLLAIAGAVGPVALAAAAAILALAIGIGLVSRPNVGDTVPTPTVSATPDPASLLLFWSGRDLPAGTYLVDEPFPVRIELTVPAGWTSYGATDTLAGICSNNCEQPDRLALAFWVVTNVYEDACDPGGVVQPAIGPSEEDLVVALGQLTRHTATDPRPEAIGGRPATALELTADDELGDCALPGFRAWIGGAEVRQSPPGEVNRLWVLEVGGQRIMVDLAIPAGASAEEVAELEEVIRSLRIAPANLKD